MIASSPEHVGIIEPPRFERREKKGRWKTLWGIVSGVRESIQRQIGRVIPKFRKEVMTQERKEVPRGEEEILRDEKVKAMTSDFAKIQETISGAKLSESICSDAFDRLSLIKDIPVRHGDHEHPDAGWLRDTGYAENLHEGYFRNAEELMSFFVNSPKHLRNVKGSFKEFGVAIQPFGEKGYRAVVLYRKGKAVDEDLRPEQILETVEHADPKTADHIHPMEKVLQAIEEEASSHHITVTRREDMGGIILKNNRGEYVVYLIRESPPGFMRRSGASMARVFVSLEKNNIFQDFKEALQEKNEAIPSSAHLEAQMMLPSLKPIGLQTQSL